ncbi:hypothetical protein LXL04_004715 [Taraxacum kok-saghyz]
MKLLFKLDMIDKEFAEFKKLGENGRSKLLAETRNLKNKRQRGGRIGSKSQPPYENERSELLAETRILKNKKAARWTKRLNRWRK